MKPEQGGQDQGARIMGVVTCDEHSDDEEPCGANLSDETSEDGDENDLEDEDAGEDCSSGRDTEAVRLGLLQAVKLEYQVRYHVRVSG